MTKRISTIEGLKELSLEGKGLRELFLEGEQTVHDYQVIDGEGKVIGQGQGNMHLCHGTSPEKGRQFYLYRGVNDSSYGLTSSLKRAHENSPKGKSIETAEKELIEGFIDEITDLKNRWSKDHPFLNFPSKDDTFRILSVMQHYGAPTRLIDFTSDFWMALFFAQDEAKNDKDMKLYRLHCKNEDVDDKHGNKTPRDENGEPWRANDNKVNINELLGYRIGYKDFAKKEDRDERLGEWKNPKQGWGWDQPFEKNPRLRSQDGFFVYATALNNALDDKDGLINHSNKDRNILENKTILEEFVIDIGLLSEIRKELEDRGISTTSVYRDLDKTLQKITNEVFEKKT